jgi:hypothetical protein
MGVPVAGWAAAVVGLVALAPDEELDLVEPHAAPKKASAMAPAAIELERRKPRRVAGCCVISGFPSVCLQRQPSEGVATIQDDKSHRFLVKRSLITNFGGPRRALRLEQVSVSGAEPLLVPTELHVLLGDLPLVALAPKAVAVPGDQLQHVLRFALGALV